MWRAKGVSDIVMLQGEVDAPSNTIQVSMGQRDNRSVEVSSPTETKTNNVNPGDGQNFQTYTLTLAWRRSAHWTSHFSVCATKSQPLGNRASAAAARERRATSHSSSSARLTEIGAWKLRPWNENLGCRMKQAPAERSCYTRSALMMSVRAARTPGTRQAASVVPSITRRAATNATGSRGLTP